MMQTASRVVWFNVDTHMCLLAKALPECILHSTGNVVRSFNVKVFVHFNMHFDSNGKTNFSRSEPVKIPHTILTTNDLLYFADTFFG